MAISCKIAENLFLNIFYESHNIFWRVFLLRMFSFISSELLCSV